MWSAGTAKSIILQVLFFLLVILRSGRPAKIRWSVCMSKSQRIVHIPFVRIVISKFVAQFPVDYFASLPPLSCLVLYSSWANLLHSLIIWLIVSSLSPLNLHLLFCLMLSILALIWLVLIALFCAAIRIDSVFLLRFPFLCYIYVFLVWFVAY